MNKLKKNGLKVPVPTGDKFDPSIQVKKSKGKEIASSEKIVQNLL